MASGAAFERSIVISSLMMSLRVKFYELISTFTLAVPVLILQQHLDLDRATSHDWGEGI